ncbi:MAG: type IV pilin protein [Patescibacteria group bacterium]
MKNNFNKAFTLVELIVVITILAVLATVAFISFQGYASSSRDSVRLADLKNVEKQLNIHFTQKNFYPQPSDAVSIPTG